MKIEIEQATKLRDEFAHYLEKMSDTIRESENLFIGKYTDQSALNPYLEELDQKKNQLMSGKFTFLVLGDFNRGKSTFLNVILGQKVLPTKSIACTAIPTFVKYGSEVQVQVYYKDGGKTNPMNLKEFKEKYTLSSDSIKDRLKRGLLSIENFITPIDCAVLECPSPLLGKFANGRIENQVEFIDSAGLNHSEEENVRTLSYAKSCDAVIFLLSAEQQLTQAEREYLEVKIKGTVGTIFFLINKWDLITKSDDDDDEDDPEEEIRGAFITGLSESLKITEKEVKKMWGKRIFEISAQAASNKLSKNETLDSTGFPEFTKSLNYFLVNDRLKSELEDANTKAGVACNKVKESVEVRLELNRKPLAEIESNITEAAPHFKDMKSIADYLRDEVVNTKNSCSEEVANSYKDFFALVISNFEIDFISQEFYKLDIDNLKKEKRDEFRKKIEQRFADYMGEKDKEWNQHNQKIV
jgi:GTPase SAR1 family protein